MFGAACAFAPFAGAARFSLAALPPAAFPALPEKPPPRPDTALEVAAPEDRAGDGGGCTTTTSVVDAAAFPAAGCACAVCTGALGDFCSALRGGGTPPMIPPATPSALPR